MSIYLGNNKITPFYLGSAEIAEAFFGSVRVYPDYNPLGLPPYTMRFQFSDSSYNPNTSGTNWKSGSTWTQVSSDPNIWDYTHVNANWQNAFVDAWTVGTPNNTATLLGANTTGITNMKSLFLGDSYLNPYKTFDTSGVTDMSNMFQGCNHLTDGMYYDTSNVTNMSSMFAGCYYLYRVPHYNTSRVTNMSNMFSGCEHLISVPLFDTHNVTNMSGMFASSSIGGNKIPNFDTSSVTTMSDMFYGVHATIFNIPFDTSHVLYMSRMFSHCTFMQQIPTLDTSSVRDVFEMFAVCPKVESGILDMYNQLSAQSAQLLRHGDCFSQCGSDTASGSAELAQIPSDWGGTAT